MTASEQQSVRMGQHWLCQLAQEFGTDAAERIDALSLWNETPANIAVAIMDSSQAEGVTQDARIVVRCWPHEKKLILRAIGTGKSEPWLRSALIEKAVRSGLPPKKDE